MWGEREREAGSVKREHTRFSRVGKIETERKADEIHVSLKSQAMNSFLVWLPNLYLEMFLSMSSSLPDGPIETTQRYKGASQHCFFQGQWVWGALGLEGCCLLSTEAGNTWKDSYSLMPGPCHSLKKYHLEPIISYFSFFAAFYYIQIQRLGILQFQVSFPRHTFSVLVFMVWKIKHN